MAKIIGKYFVALVPDGEVQKGATAIKEDLRDKFGLKYSLKSPAHVTLKMPFSWNEAKENVLTKSLEEFAKEYKSIKLHFIGFGKFGNRVIFVRVKRNQKLVLLQASIAEYFKRELKLVKELSDTNYHPHMTVAFKDVKAKDFEKYWAYVNSLDFDYEFQFDRLVLLKRIDNRWFPLSEIPLKKEV